MNYSNVVAAVSDRTTHSNQCICQISHDYTVLYSIIIILTVPFNKVIIKWWFEIITFLIVSLPNTSNWRHFRDDDKSSSLCLAFFIWSVITILWRRERSPSLTAISCKEISRKGGRRERGKKEKGRGERKRRREREGVL